jgi:hypothetical protein
MDQNNINNNEIDNTNNEIDNTNNEIDNTNNDNEIDNIIYDENGMPIYDEDCDEIEMRQNFYNNFKNKNFDNYDIYSCTKINNNEEKINIKNNIKKNKIISLFDFNNVVNENKPKKFISKRITDKKKELKLDNNIPKRTFNPRLVPYYFSDIHNNYKKNYNIDKNFNSNDNFPPLN